MIDMIQYVLESNVFNVRQALIQTNLQGYSNDNVPRVPPILGVALLVSVH